MAPAHDDLPRSFHGDRYLLTELIGEGGMAWVYRATDRVLLAPRAVKILRSRQGQVAHNRQVRMLREARAMEKVAHPNVVRVYDYGECEEGSFLVMELVEGGCLADLVQLEGPQSPLKAVDWTMQVLAALTAAHAAGVLHRDVKAANVLLDRDGTARLADFGIALVMDDERFTRTRISMGSLAYMPPEQRLNAKEVDLRADLYSTACTLYYLLTASTPVDLFLADEGSSRWEQVPEVLRPVLLRATRARPEDRFESATAFREALQAVRRLVPTVAAASLPALEEGAGEARTADSVGWPGRADPHSTLAGSVERTGAGGTTHAAPSTAAERPAERPRADGPWVVLVALLLLAGAVMWAVGGRGEGSRAVSAIAPATPDRPTPAVASTPPTTTPTVTVVSSTPPAAPTPELVATPPPVVTPAPTVAPTATSAPGSTARPRPAPSPTPAALAAAPRGVPGDWWAGCLRSGRRSNDLRGCWQVESWFGVPRFLLIEDGPDALVSVMWERTAKGEWRSTAGVVVPAEGRARLVEDDAQQGFEMWLELRPAGLWAEGRGRRRAPGEELDRAIWVRGGP